MEWKEFTLGENDAGRRLDRLARRLLPHRTQGQIYSALRKGLIKSNGRKAAPGQTTCEGDTLSVAAFLLQESHADECATPSSERERSGKNDIGHEKKLPPEKIQVIFQNRHLLFVNKRSGIPVHGKGSLAQILLTEPSLFLSAHSAPAETSQIETPPAAPCEKSISFRPGPLHRLDKETTGIIAFSKSLAGARWFSEEIRSHSIRKTYVGIAEGTIEREEEWVDKIEGKEARTKASPLAYGKVCGRDATLVQYEISTGRKHQIRIHSEAHGHPLIGDAAHGWKRGNAESDAQGGQGKGRFFLHALKMEFPQNNLGVPPELRASLPKEFLAAIAEAFPNSEGLFKSINLENV